ncbi:rRNA maturation RNase YbeY [Candidatus Poriferisocius sp.]|uniref:rRNA maturation RNase YbeY n=1 Tax=Candidatus Poriferisocius sp. TaxID=3101276 RepID=UPI003B01D9CE
MTADGDGVPRPSGSDIDAAVVVVLDGQRDLTVDEERWAGLLRRVLSEEQVPVPWEAGLSFVEAGEMAALNATHRGIDRPTDVLAFGADDGSAPRGPDEPRLVGDVVICPSIAAANAETRGASIDDELALLVVHGALHLLGYDHIDDRDAQKMEGRERELLALAEATAVTASRWGSS